MRQEDALRRFVRMRYRPEEAGRSLSPSVDATLVPIRSPVPRAPEIRPRPASVRRHGAETPNSDIRFARFGNGYRDHPLLRRSGRSGRGAPNPEACLPLPREITGARVRCENPSTELTVNRLEIHQGECLDVASRFGSGSFDLIYIDPPFNSGRVQSRTRLKTVRDDDGDRIGFNGNRYATRRLGESSFDDRFDDFAAFIEPRLEEAHRLLTPCGAFFLHIDCRESHYCKIILDRVFGRESFMNEIIWAYDYGSRSKRRWSAKHDTIFWYAKNPNRYIYNYDEIDRVPYMAPELVGPEKAARGKTPTDVWWNTIVSPQGKEKTGYPTQKPLAILNRIIRVHSNPSDRVLDFFAGSGTTGEAANRNGRDAVLVDISPEAVDVMSRRLAHANPMIYGRESDGADARPGGADAEEG